MKRIIITYCLLIFPFLLFANGVLFSGNSSLVDKRTSYSVFNPENIPTFQDELTMSFEIQIKEFNTFGYLFSLQDQVTNNSYILVFTFDNHSHSLFQFNTEGKSNHTTIKFSNNALNHRWIPIRLSINKKEQLINLSINGEESRIRLDLGKDNEIRPQIIFGKKDYMVDLPSFALRNLKIYNKQTDYHFTFQESNGDIVHNKDGKAMGTIEHPTWLINESYYWKNIFQDYRTGPCAINFDDRHNNIYIVSQDSLSSFSLEQNSLHTYPYANDLPLGINLGTSFYDQTTHKMYLYEPYDVPCGECSVVALDLDSIKWEPVDYQSLESQLHHHNRFFDANQRKLLLFGGFGNQKYHNTFISYDLPDKRIDTLHIKDAHIDPRFYSGMANRGDSIIYLYGGVGNQNGMQSLGKKYYNDLYEINLRTQSLVRKWEFPAEENQAVGNTMVFSEKDTTIYALKYKEYNKHSFVQLYQLGLNDNTIEKVGDTIPFLSEAIKTSLFLFHSQVMDKIYCVIHERNESSDTTRIAAYELAFPPVSCKSINQTASKKEGKITYFLPFIAVAIAVLALVTGILVWKRKKQTVEIEEETEDNHSEPHEEVPAKDITHYKNSIYLFGNFCVYDSFGRDITYLFSAKLKYIFIYILTCETEEGVLSSSLNNIFWADKEDSKIKNLKGVTINHLRKIIADIEGVSLIYKNKYFYLDIQEPCYCDYIQSMKAMKEKFGPGLLAILQRGKFLDGINEELFDYTKSRIEDLFLNYLTNELLTDSNELNKDKADICQAILSIDSLNEHALSMLIKIYERHRMKAPALEAYSLFTKEYKKVMDKEYPYTLEEVLKKEIIS